MSPKKELELESNGDSQPTSGSSESNGEPKAPQQSKPQEPVGSKCSLKIWQERYNAEGEQEKVEVPDLGGSPSVDAEYAVVVRQIFSERNRLDLTRLTVNSPHILKAFRDVVGSHPAVPADFSEPFDMESPFQMLYHSWDDLVAYKEKLEDESARNHLDVLFKYMNVGLAPEKNIVENMTRKSMIDFQRLWMIYRPGKIAVTYTKGHPWLMQIVKAAYDENNNCGKYLEVHTIYTDYDGKDVGVAKKSIKILQKVNFGQENSTNITELPIFPREFIHEGPELEERLIERGKKFTSLQGVSIKHYDGLADILKESPPSYWHPDMEDFALVWVPYTESGRIIVDRKTFQEDHYQGAVAKKAEISERDLVLCPPFAYGFSVARKQWSRFYLEHIRETIWKTDAFDSLILPQSQLNLVRALVSAHKFPENPRDQIEQKSKGLVALLHGPPGSGKTLTAECAAEETRRVLFSTSMSELNKYNDAYWFERELKQVLRLATLWKSVVLFDEADVFLEARGNDSSGPATIERNALVAVFLRHLEYFSGIVFLTTNRIHVFDAAMKSRVHLALGYSPPEQESRRRIWTRALLKIPQEDRDLELDSAVERLAGENLNGREIFNTINTAYTLARFEKLRLCHDHIDTVLGVRKDFESSLERAASQETKPKNNV
ncbi:P-loop containing nucleoside triphosphate hydrolase protein [Acrodontium crateriforme]|uniref:P-loop containing nucleoside triphosphate hydrolase protein n=1 Tax=Acrodontium crateriforme TaxID=150365 RepID=A0AAQ3M272_9PEZI|nr:P-loop containing nucleoside triphosphate hydrolase protein [Acrodontium crateriforme]